MTGKQKTIVALAAAHLLLVAYHSATLPLPGWGNPATDALRWYGAVSGANNSYGFFKQVGCSIRVSFVMLDKDENVLTDEIYQGENREVQLRFASASNFLDGHHTQALMRNWAAAMFGRHPEARFIRVKIETYDPGKMEDYAAGIRPQWIDQTKGMNLHTYNREQFTGE